MANEPRDMPKDKKQPRTTVPGGLLSDQSFAEDRDEVEGGTKNSPPAPAEGQSKP